MQSATLRVSVSNIVFEESSPSNRTNELYYYIGGGFIAVGEYNNRNWRIALSSCDNYCNFCCYLFQKKRKRLKKFRRAFYCIRGVFNLVLRRNKIRVPGSDRKSFEIGSARTVKTESTFSRNSNSLSSFRSSKIELQTPNPKPRLSITQLSSVRIAAKSQVVVHEYMIFIQRKQKSHSKN